MSNKVEEGQPTSHLTRWHLLLTLSPSKEENEEISFTEQEARMARVLYELYGREKGRPSLSKSQPKLHRWLSDIRHCFPSPIVQMMQKDAIERHGIEELLLESEMWEKIEPDVHLVATILSLQQGLSDELREQARQIVQEIVNKLQEKLEPLLLQSIRGRIRQNLRSHKRTPSAIDWHRVIRANLKHYQKEYQTIIPEKWYSFGHAQRGLKDLIILVDQSASMAESVIYASIYAAILAHIKTFRTQLVFFDTSVVDMTKQMNDPIDLLFGSQLGGGTNIGKALQYAEQCITRPGHTHLFLISDMDEGGDRKRLIRTLYQMKQAGTHITVLLNLSDEGKPHFAKDVAKQVAALDIPAFACTPDEFPEILGRTLKQ